jgi:hypothetical protein
MHAREAAFSTSGTVLSALGVGNDRIISAPPLTWRSAASARGDAPFVQPNAQLIRVDGPAEGESVQLQAIPIAPVFATLFLIVICTFA